MVDLHAHLPQLPNAGLGCRAGPADLARALHLPARARLRRGRRPSASRPLAWRAFAAAGTTTALVYGAVYEASLDATFRAAEAHGIRAIVGKVMMDRMHLRPDDRPRDDPRADPARVGRPHRALARRATTAACSYAVTPRFAVSCTADLLRESAALAASTGAYWQTHVSEDRGEIAEVARLFPEALDYVDVYDRAGGLGERTVLAHAVHLSDRELARLVETGTRVAHCPASNLFLASGVMPLGRYLEAGLSVGLGSDVAGGPDLSIFTAMRVGAYAQNALATRGRRARPGPGAARLAAARHRWAGRTALGLDDAHRLARGRQGGRPDRDRPVVRGAHPGRRPTTTPTTS